MKTFGYKAFLLTLLPFLILSTALAAPVETEGKKTDRASIVVKSNTLEIDNKQKVVLFSGDVEARQEGMTITCREMVVYYRDQPSEKAEGETEMAVDRITATGAVKIRRPDGSTATAEKAIYYQDEEKLVLTGNPVVRQENDFVEGSMITLFLKEERSIVVGSESQKVRAVLSPRSGKR